jgi:DNA-directed RNA polymerase
VRLDYRGILYCISDYLIYQGVKISKSLLEISIGEKKIDFIDELTLY